MKQMSRVLSSILAEGLNPAFTTWIANKAEFDNKRELRKAITEGEQRLQRMEGEKKAKEAQLSVFTNTQEVLLGHMDLMTQATYHTQKSCHHDVLPPTIHSTVL